MASPRSEDAVYHSEPAPEVSADRPANSLCYTNDGVRGGGVVAQWSAVKGAGEIGEIPKGRK